MSSATAAIRFEDGVVLFGVYSGTADVMQDRFFPTVDEAWTAHRTPAIDRGDMPTEPNEQVQVYSDYGGGFSWAGRATRAGVLVEGHMPYGAESWGGEVILPVLETVDGTPDWYVEALKPPS